MHAIRMSASWHMSASWQHDNDGLTRFGDAFSDPTRRLLYELVVRAPEPLSASAAGDLAGVHRTVARSHLERLVAAGVLCADLRRAATTGRPAKVYRASRQPESVTVPPRQYSLLARLLAEAILDLASSQTEAAAAAAAAGWAYGRMVGRQLTRGSGATGKAAVAPSALAVADWLNEGGCAARGEDGERTALSIGVCVFAEPAFATPHVVCSLDRGLIAGLLAVDEARLRALTCLTAGDRECRFEVVW